MPKSRNYISWNEYFMGIAELSAMRSKDPNTKVGACIVDPNNRVVSIGYNGLPNGCSDDEFPWDREADHALDTKYPYVAHAELNAILNCKTMNLSGCTIYVSLFPCNECAKAIIQSGIKRVIYACDKYADTTESMAARRLFNAAGVEYRQYNMSHIDIKLK